jgi:hypothetical protein
VERVERALETTLPIAGALGELSKLAGVDLSAPVRRKVFRGTPFEREFEADLVARWGEATAVLMAKRAPSDGAGGIPVEVECVVLTAAILTPAAPLVAAKVRGALDFLVDSAVGMAQRLKGVLGRRGR